MPICPMNRVSVNDATGSAASAKRAGNAIERISRPKASPENTFLDEKFQQISQNRNVPWWN